MTPAEARRHALLKLGGADQTKEAYRDRRGLPLIGQFLKDLRFGVRMLVKERWMTAVAILSLALAIGATTAMVGLVRALVFRPLSVRDPYSLIQVATEPRPSVASNLPFPAFREMARGQRVLTSLMGLAGVSVYAAETPQGLMNATTMGVSANFYDELDVHAVVGRLFTAGEFTTEPEPVAILGYHFWRDAFGADPAVVGRTVRVDGVPLTVIGVAPPGFSNLNVVIEPAVTVPLPMYPVLITQRLPIKPWSEDPNVTWVTAVGRMKPGVTLDQARAQFAALWPGVRTSLAPLIADPGRRADFLKLPLTVRSAATGFEQYGVRTRFTTPSYVVLGIALLVLIIACVNVASLLLSRAAAREREIAVRVALGASRGRLVRQLFCEGVLLSSLATVGGVAAALWASRAFPALVFANAVIPMGFDASPDGVVLLGACAMAIVTAGLFSLAPIWRATRHAPAASLQQQHRTVVQTGRMGRALVAGQVALCLVLMTAAGLLVRSLEEIRAVDAGVQTAGVTVAFPSPQPGAYKVSDNDAYYPALIERVRSLPGVRAVGIAQLKPLGGQAAMTNVGAVGSDHEATAAFTSCSPGLFEALGIGVVAGRDFSWADNSHSRPVAIVSRSLARRLFGNGDPIGQEIRMGSYADERSDVEQVVGVIADARAYDVKDPNVDIAYIPSLQRNAAANGKALVIRGSVSAHDLNRAIEPLGKDYVNNAADLNGILDASLLQERLTSTVAGFFGLLALSLSAIGLYGLMSYSVVQRRREIGIRVALGGQIRRVTWQMLRAGLTVTVSGLAAGLAVAWMTTRLVGSLLFNVQPHDLATLTFAPLLLLVVGIGACWIPAWRAARVDPAIVLRNE